MSQYFSIFYLDQGLKSQNQHQYLLMVYGYENQQCQMIQIYLIDNIRYFSKNDNITTYSMGTISYRMPQHRIYFCDTYHNSILSNI